MRDRRIGLFVIAATALAILSLHRPNADIRILTHDPADRAPARVQAAFDLGVIAVSVLVTWTRKLV